MPLPTDEKLIALSQDVLQQFDTIFGLNPGFRPAHAKGIAADGDVHAFGGCGYADEGAAYCAGVNAGDSAILGFDRHSSGTG